MTGFKKTSLARLLILISIGVILGLIVNACRGAEATQRQNLIQVKQGDDLQAALDNAHIGDIIELEAGATFTGNYLLPAKNGPGWITIRTSKYADLPPGGSRITPADTPLLAKIQTSNTQAALTSKYRAHNYKFHGIEFTTTNNLTYNIVRFGHNGLQNGFPPGVWDLPHHIQFHHCYIHGTPDATVRVGLAANINSCVVRDCYISDCHDPGADSQAIVVSHCIGPMEFVNNHLEGAGENLMIGGSEHNFPDAIPMNILIQGNYFYKPLRWSRWEDNYDGHKWIVKNLLEFKTGRNILIQGNVFENNWAGQGQHGDAILFHPRGQASDQPWNVLEDVTFQNNMIINSPNGMSMSPGGKLDNGPLRNLLIRNNVIQTNSDASESRAFIKASSPINGQERGDDVVVINNTMFSSGVKDMRTALVFGDNVQGYKNFTFEHNICEHGTYGIHGGGQGAGIPGLDFYCENWSVKGNIFIKETDFGRNWPEDNLRAPTMAQIGLIGYGLSPNSPFKNLGLGRKNPGVNWQEFVMSVQNAKRGKPF